VENLRTALHLTEGQVIAIERIETQAYSEYIALNNEALSGVARKEKLQQLKKDKEASLKEVLTPTQWASYIAYMEKQAEKVKRETEARRRQLQAKSLSNGN